MYRDEAIALLRWLAYARSPLSLGELVKASVIDLKSIGYVNVNNRGDVEDALNILSGLVDVEGISGNNGRYNNSSHERERESIGSEAGSCETRGSDKTIEYSRQQLTQDTRIRPAHFSVKEYMESKRISKSHAKDFHLDGPREHMFLAHSSLNYLMHYSRSHDKMSTKQDLTGFPLLTYTARSWCYHSLLEISEDVSRETSFFNSTDIRHDWLLIHQPDRPHQMPFGDLENMGSTLYYVVS